MAPGALELADAAARSCLERADRTADELDLLINAGVFHDKILSEPAFASLIQEDIGANPSQPGRRGSRNVLVRRLQRGLWPADGHSAWLTACSRRGRPSSAWWSRATWTRSRASLEGFGFPAVGGAVLLSADDSRAGFTAFRFATFPEFAELFQSYVDWQDDAARAGSPVTAGTSSPSRSPSPTPRGRSSAPSRPSASWRRRRRSTSPRSTCSSPPRRSRASPTHWRRDSACPPSGSRASEEGLADAHTAALALALESVRLADVEHDAVRLRGRGDHRRRRALPGVI